MTKPRLHLDADTSNAALADALQKRGHDGRLVPYHDVTRTPNEWMPLDAHDDVQLLGATAQGRCIFTFNARDYVSLAKRYPHHGGIILSSQRTMPELLKALDTLLSETEAEDWPGQVRWLCDWMK
ncbi:MAG: DUF5615 family PIN-like protein [Anaerolineales bacterium]|nr:DUF5615 family PIN-like protein [Anaerolineales bacterium]MDP3183891.1 DUF5615 family PIN-like protein [Anaerolineales bacterium]